MTEKQTAVFEAADGSFLRACDFGPEFGDEERYLSLPDLEPIVPIHPEGVYFVCSRSVLATLRHETTA